jgi:predicted nucleic-acid-binding protein
MIGLDTNILLRFTLKDDPVQFALASRLFQSELTAANPGYVNLVVLVEFAWTLKRTFKLSRQAICGVIAHLLGTPNVLFERSAAVAQAIDLSERKALDLPDALISAINGSDGCAKTVSFDEAFAATGEAVLLG